MPVAAVQRKARRPLEVSESPTITDPFDDTSYAALPKPPSEPVSCIPPAWVQRNAFPFRGLSHDDQAVCRHAECFDGESPAHA